MSNTSQFEELFHSQVVLAFHGTLGERAHLRLKRENYIVNSLNSTDKG